MTRTSPATDHWSVTTRTQGGVQSAVASLPSIEMALLGIPEGFTAAEIQSWLRDLAGVAVETSRTDERSRPIPQLLHHVLTGLLFSQTELWSHTGQALPCAAVFVETPQGAAFGWVGRARVVLLVNGEPLEPQWVIVRDESGQEAMSAMLPPQSHVLLTLEYWPHGESGQQAPASADAEWGQSFANRPAIAGESPRPAASSANVPRPVASPMPVTPAATTPGSSGSLPAPSTVAGTPASGTTALPVRQPGLAPDPTRGLSLDEQDSTQSLPSTFHASSSTFAMPSVPGAGPLQEVPRPETELTRGADTHEPGHEQEPGHPVGRWLTRLMGFGKKTRIAPEPEPMASMPIEPAPSPTLAPLARAPESPPPLASPALAPLSPPTLTPPTLTPPVLATVAPPTLATPPLAPASPATAPAIPPPVASPAAPKNAPVAPVLSSPGAPASAPPPPPTTTPTTVQAPSAPPSAATNQPPIVPQLTTPIAPPSPPQAAPPAKGGLLAVGLSDILGSLGSIAAPKPAAPSAEGPAIHAAPPTPPSPVRAVAPATPPSPPSPPSRYPVLEVTPPRPTSSAGGPIQIEREPVGAAAEFAIPRLPPRDAPKPFRVPVPTAADTLKPATPASPGAPPASASAAAAATPSSASTPAPARPPVPVPGAPAAASAPATHQNAPAPPVVPEPPADFLAEFAASLGADIKDLPPPAPSTEVRRPVPLLPSVMRAVANVPPASLPPPASAIAPLPATASVPLAPALPVEPPPPAAPPPLLITPSEQEPISVSQSELPVILRELPLPPSATPPESDVPDGMLVATPLGNARVRRAQWPAEDEFEPAGRPAWRNPWLIGAFVAVLFGVGWIVGHSQTADNDIHATPITRMLKAVGLAGARFTASIDSDPPGAIISVDGKEIGRRTPATIELTPGAHQVTLSMPDLGQVDLEVKGSRGQSIKVSEGLHGSLEVATLDRNVPVKVSLDGQALGFLPQTVDKLPPGLHEVQFSGPNMQPWAQNVSVPIRGTVTVTARPMMSPATGVLQVQAILNDESGSAPLSGASLFVDGELKGTTPETLELPRGPHSLKVTYRGVTAPVQVIDLPGGNKRFAQFQFGLDSDLPPLKLKSDYNTLPAKKSVLIEAALDGLDWKDLREAWLHVRTSEGLWRRYQVTVEEGPRGALLSANFPAAVGDAGTRVNWYMSAATNQGDDFYTEMQRSTR